MRLLIIRHADPEYVYDSLTEAGRREARALADRLYDGLEGRPTRLYTSPMGRARATAAAAEKKLGIKAEVEHWTKELSDWPRLGNSGGARPGEGGMALWDLSPELVRQIDAPLGRNSQWGLVPDLKAVREKYESLCAESDKFLARHGYVQEGGRYRVEGANTDILAVFCHGGFGLTWLSHLLDIPLATIWSSFW